VSLIINIPTLIIEKMKKRKLLGNVKKHNKAYVAEMDNNDNFMRDLK